MTEEQDRTASSEQSAGEREGPNPSTIEDVLTSPSSPRTRRSLSWGGSSSS